MKATIYRAAPNNNRRRTAAPTELTGSRGDAGLMLALTVITSVPALFELNMAQAAVGLGALTTVPLIASMFRQRRLIPSEPIVIVGLLYFVALTLPYISQVFNLQLYQDPAWSQRTTWSINLAGLWLYRGWAACCVAYWLLRKLSPSRANRRRALLLQREDKLRVTIGVVGLAAAAAFLVSTGGQAYSHIEGLANTSTFNQLIGELRAFATVYVFLYYHARGRDRLIGGEKYLLWAVFAALALIFGATSSKSVPLEVGAAWLLGSAAGASRARPMRDIVLAALAYFLVYCTFYVITAYRIELAAQPVNPNATFSDAVSVQFDALSKAFSGLVEGRQANPDGRGDNSEMLDRLAHVLSLALVFDTTSGFSPYEHSWELVLSPVLALLPRDFIGDKVVFMNSGAFAQLQGWSFGGLSLTTVGSIFWSWGFQGIVFGMMFLGALLSRLHAVGMKDGPLGLIGRCLMMRMVLSMMDVGSDFQPIVVGVERMFFILLALLLITNFFGSGAKNAPPR